MVALIHFFIITLIYSNPSVQLQSSIYSVVSGNLLETLQFDFTLIVKEFIGVVLYCIDSRGNQIGITVLQVGKKYIKLSFNKNVNSIKLTELCECDPCDGTNVHFRMYIEHTILKISCNHLGYKSLSGLEDRSKINDITMYPVPSKIVNTDQIYIMIGNIDISNVRIKDQLKGCLKDFHYDNQSVNFTTYGDVILPTCRLICSDNACNDGKCTESLDGIICDCSSAALNGPNCNDSMKNFTQENNSYVKVKNATYIFMKITWNSSRKNYLIFEIISGNSNLMMVVNNGNLLLDSTLFSTMNEKLINFVSINISYHNSTIRTHNLSQNIDLKIKNNLRINIGFSDKNSTYETFDGLYDFSAHNLIRDYSHVDSTTPDTTVTHQPSTKSIIHQPSTKDTINGNQKVYSIFCIAIAINFGLSLLIAIACNYKRIFNRILKRNTITEERPKNSESIIHNDTPYYYSTIDYSMLDALHQESSDDYLPVADTTYLEMKPTLPTKN